MEKTERKLMGKLHLQNENPKHFYSKSSKKKKKSHAYIQKRQHSIKQVGWVAEAGAVFLSATKAIVVRQEKITYFS